MGGLLTHKLEKSEVKKRHWEKWIPRQFEYSD